MTKISDLHKKWLKDAEYRRAYDALEKEFSAAVDNVRTRVTPPPSHSHTLVRHLPRKRGRKS